MRQFTLLLFLSALFSAALLDARAATNIVTTFADSGAGSLRNAIATAASGDTVTFAANLSGQTILLNAGQLSLNNSVTLDASALPGGILINARGITRVFNVGNGATVVLTALTITGGTDLSATGGGGIYNAGNLTVNQCTLVANFVNNINSSASGGGGIFNSGLLTLNQCTLAFNHSDNDSATDGGGAVFNTGTLKVNQCTVTTNSADNSGGGGGIYNTGTLNIFNSIIAGNTSLGASGADIFSSTFNPNLNGANIIEDFNGLYSGSPPINADPQLSPLNNYGGPTLTLRPLPGSPAVNACLNTAHLAADQRGVLRLPGITDIGSVQLALPTVVSFPATAVTNTSATMNATVDPNALATTAWFQWGTTNNPYSSQTIAVALGSGQSTLSFSSNLTLLTPGTIYHYRMVASNSEGVASGNDITFSFATVTNLSDVGPGSLDQLIADAAPSGGIITFAANLSGATTFNSATVSKSITIDASSLPGGIQINANGGSRIFDVSASGAGVVLTGLTITNAYDTQDAGGAGVRNTGTLTLNRCTLAGNYADAEDPFADGRGNGGAIYNTGNLTLNQCVLAGNFAFPNGNRPGGNGGGIYNTGALTLNQCTLIGNQSGVDGGGIWNSGSLALNQCNLIKNTSGGNGGGIVNEGGGLTVNGCTLATNSARQGGGIYIQSVTVNTSVTLTQCTLSENFAEENGGGIYNSSTLTVYQSTLTGNYVMNFDPDGSVGGGIFDGGDLTLFNSVVAGNSILEFIPGDGDYKDIGGLAFLLNLHFGGANVVQDFVQEFNGPAPITNAPALAALGNYGGPTQTMPPLPGSPVIDGCTNGNNFTNGSGVVFTLSATDQRGFQRAIGLAPDIGAVEGIYNAAGPGRLTGMARLSNDSTKFTFTNFTDTSFTILANTNVTLPISTWANLGPAVESPIGSGQFQFTDAQATNYPQRFYRVRTP